MEALDKIFTEDQVNEISDKILKSTIEKVKTELADNFYNEVGNFFYEHYSNCSDKIKESLINEMAEQYIKEPSLFKYRKLRDILWKENKDEILKSLTDEAIHDSIENILLHYTHLDYHFNWQWKDGIVRVILSNWDKFKDDERINQGFGREIDRLKSQITNLQQRLSEITNIVE